MIRGALITMPHKVTTVGLLDEVTTVGLLDEVTPTDKVAGSCNAIRRAADGRLYGDMFDGEGFVRGLRRKGCKLKGARGGGGRRRGGLGEIGTASGMENVVGAMRSACRAAAR